MTWLVTIAIACLGLIGGGMGMFAIGNLFVRWYRIPSFEGASGYFVIGLTTLGAVGGFLLAALGARLGYSLGNATWVAQAVGGVVAVVGSLGIVLAVGYARLDSEPLLDGRKILVAWELRLPVEGTDVYLPRGNPSEWPEKELMLQLVAVRQHKPVGSREAAFDRAAFHRVEGQWILPATTPLFSSLGEYCVNLTLGGRDDGFWPPMRASTHPGYLEWSAWHRTNKSSSARDDAHAIMYRFRFAPSQS